MPIEPTIYTVSQVNLMIRQALADNLPARLIVAGQITDWKHHHSGHCYFSLKDETSQLPCVMWKSNFARIKFRPENGLAVLAGGYIDVYAPHGKYQLYVETMQPEGTGALQLAFEQTVKKLQAEGLFDEKYKKPLPAYPMRIGILTSESGAAVHDITDSIHNRWPCARLFLYPVPVQGKAAAEAIAAALRDINRRNKDLGIELLIVGRGGGSLEDLWAFNEEVVARAIFDSKIPIISAVGHEVDVTVADFVADARASTPTKAGVVAVPDIQEVLAKLDNIESRLRNNALTSLSLAHRSLETVLASVVFKTPKVIVFNRQQQLDQSQALLADSLRELVSLARTKLSSAYDQILKIEPHRLLGKKAVEVGGLENRAFSTIRRIINAAQLQLAAQANRLQALNPRSVLQRGYSITTSKKTGLVIKKPDDVEINDEIVTELADEKLIESKVTKK